MDMLGNVTWMVDGSVFIRIINNCRRCSRIVLAYEERSYAENMAEISRARGFSMIPCEAMLCQW